MSGTYKRLYEPTKRRNKKLGWDELHMYLKLALSATSSLPRLASINLIVVGISATKSSFVDKEKVRLSK